MLNTFNQGELPIEELLKRYGAPGSLADSNDGSDTDNETDEESIGEDDISDRGKLTEFFLLILNDASPINISCEIFMQNLVWSILFLVIKVFSAISQGFVFWLLN